MKGNSECRFDRLAGAGAGTADELCTFEQLPRRARGTRRAARRRSTRYPRAQHGAQRAEGRPRASSRRSASTRSASASSAAPTRTTRTAGSVDESGWEGGAGQQRRVARAPDRRRRAATTRAASPSCGRRRTRATRSSRRSGGARPTPPAARGRWCASSPATSPASTAARADFVARRLRERHADGRRARARCAATRARASPCWAMKDPGTARRARAPTCSASRSSRGGSTRRARRTSSVFDVAGDAANGAGVDPATCAPTGRGARRAVRGLGGSRLRPRRARLLLRARAREPDLPLEHARLQGGRRRSASPPTAPRRPPRRGPAFADCCLGPANDAFVEPVDPGARLDVADLVPARGDRARRGRRSATGRIRVPIGCRCASGSGVCRRDRLRQRRSRSRGGGRRADLPPRDSRRYCRGAPRRRGGSRRGTAFDLVGSPARARCAAARNGAARPPAADPIDHMVSVSLRAGTYESTHTRLWHSDGARLFTGG